MRALPSLSSRSVLSVAMRAAVTRAPGGASSLLRLSAATGAARLPSGAALGVWIGRAARSLGAAA